MHIAVTELDGQLKEQLIGNNAGTIVGELNRKYRRVINFVTTDQQSMISMAMDSIVPAPSMIKIADEDSFRRFWHRTIFAEKMIYLGRQQLRVSHFVLDFSQATVWSSQLGSAIPVYDQLKSQVETIDHFLMDYGNRQGILAALYGLQQDRVDKLSIHQRYLAEQLNQLCVERDTRVLKNFLGVGIGLTPSGDDFLTGFLATWQYWQNHQLELVDSKQDWLDLIKQHTTFVSGQMLKHCFFGRINTALKTVITKGALVNKNDLQTLVAIGSSSGTDMLVGVLIGLQLIIKSKFQRGNKEDDVKGYR
ncbi:DUF2877 domain-containing protein [Amphibacillus sediminis]|uniref:DUF2877 domain-containing protein n=1 Tax=Amphibacillus sediminis TaxID=360185 RepID=UPI00083599DC|nr:DUF2877 domain-containing protein [Amphibacillus sediminis]